ncbi:kanadaptin isoform X2 [Pelobates fuscus]|uniref:kanadaptin isoform X2 n=1 Tax=Pelobates fuscus TaxID=191477 RepID=UPI002FE46229
MEAARLEPNGGQGPHDPGDAAMETGHRGEPEGPPDTGPGGGKGAPTAGTWSNEGPRDAGARSNEGPRDAGARSNEGPRDAGARSNEGPRDAGARSTEGPRDAGVRSNEGPRDAGVRSNEGPRDAGVRSTEDPRDAGVRSTEDPRDAGVRSNEDPRDAGVRSNEDPRDAGVRSNEDPRDAGVRSNEDPRDAGVRSTEGPRDAGVRSTEGPRDAGVRDAGSRDTETRFVEGPRDARATKGSNSTDTSNREGPRTLGTRSHEGPRDSRTSTCEELKPPGCRSHETSHSTTTDAENQWAANSEGLHPSQSNGNETSITSGTSSSKEPYFGRTSTSQKLAGTESCSEPNDGDGSNDTKDNTEGPTDARITDSFKMPTIPARSSGNEKTVEQRDKPATSHISPSLGIRGTTREASTDVSHRLPSDAYRTSPAIPYREPSWSGQPQALYNLEMLKNGNIVSTKSLNELDWIVFGRLPSCHISLEHPSVSRYHAVLQYRQIPGTEPDQEPGFYIYDLDSTHGTYLNKQRIPPKTYCRFRVGHMVKFGGSTRLFVLQGPEDDQEEESELTVTQIKEARRQKESLQRKMLGDDSDEEDVTEETEKSNESTSSGQDAGCTWGMGDDAIEEENDENPIAMEFQEEREALYMKDPKKALKGFFEREGEELEYEYEDRGLSIWLCRVRLPADDSSGKQLVAEVLHTGKKKDASKVCALEACRMLDMRGLFRQEAVSRKRKSKQWEAEDFYDSDDDTFLDRTGLVEKKRLHRMKKAGKIEEKAETYDSLVAKLAIVEKEVAEIASKLKTSRTDEAHSSGQGDSLDAFMTDIKSGVALDAVTRKKLHLQSFELKKEQERLKGLIKIAQPTRLPDLITPTQESTAKKITLPMFGAMKGGRKFKLKTGTVGTLPPKRADLPARFFATKDDSNQPVVEEEEEEDDDLQKHTKESQTLLDSGREQTAHEDSEMRSSPDTPSPLQPPHAAETEHGEKKLIFQGLKNVRSSDPKDDLPGVSDCRSTELKEEKKTNVAKQKKVQGPSRPPQTLTSLHYPEDDPDYSVWTPPADQTGDGRTHLNEKYGY